jgi:hypothetical protein
MDTTGQLEGLKLGKLLVLARPANYNHWAASWRIILDNYKCREVIERTMEKPTGEPEIHIQKTVENSLNTWKKSERKA